jgi:hypothetical protein
LKAKGFQLIKDSLLLNNQNFITVYTEFHHCKKERMNGREKGRNLKKKKNRRKNTPELK